MQGKISMELPFCQAETVFSPDEPAAGPADVQERKAFAEVWKMILQMCFTKLGTITRIIM